MSEILNQIARFAKLQKRRNCKFRIFALSDPSRSAAIEEMDALIGEDIFIIWRTFGENPNERNFRNQKRILPSLNFQSARKLGFKGSHLPSKSKNTLLLRKGEMLLTQSAHDIGEVLKAIKNRADYILISPIFKSQSPSAIGISRANHFGPIKIAQMVRLFPNQNFCALGGINAKNAKRLDKTQIKAIAGVSFE